MGKTFCSGPCDICGKIVSCNGMAAYQHNMKHAREGIYIRQDRGGFKLTELGAELRSTPRRKRDGLSWNPYFKRWDKVKKGKP